MEKSHNTNNQNSVTEQNVSQLGSSLSGMSAEELYRKKEEYDAKFTLYKGSIPNR